MGFNHHLVGFNGIVILIWDNKHHELLAINIHIINHE